MTTGTIYSIHRASDHEIIATANPKNLQSMAAHIAQHIHAGLPDRDLKSTRVYVHNGLGVVAAGLIRQDLWHDTLRENYMPFDDKARAERDAAGLPNDPKKEA